MSRIIVITGTDTDIGKTIATAALVCTLQGGQTLVMVKPVQTGVGPGDSGDADEVHRLTGCSAQEFTALPDPLAPDTAALVRGLHIPLVSEYADRIRVLADFHDVILVEGAGGLLVRFDAEGGTILDLADELEAEVVIVTSPRLGTLNHTELTVNALRARGIEPTGLIIGSWPGSPGLAEECNADDLPRLTHVPVIATIPEGVGSLSPEEFRAQAPSWFA